MTGAMVTAAGVVFHRHAEGVAGPALVVYGALLLIAGVSVPDAPGGGSTVHGVLHLASGGLGFIAFAVAAFASGRRFARRGDRGWSVFSALAGTLLIIGFVAVASGSSAAAVVLRFTATVVLSWVWLALASIRSYSEAGAAGRTPALQVAAMA